MISSISVIRTLNIGIASHEVRCHINSVTLGNIHWQSAQYLPLRSRGIASYCWCFCNLKIDVAVELRMAYETPTHSQFYGGQHFNCVQVDQLETNSVFRIPKEYSTINYSTMGRYCC